MDDSSGLVKLLKKANINCNSVGKTVHMRILCFCYGTQTTVKYFPCIGTCIVFTDLATREGGQPLSICLQVHPTGVQVLNGAEVGAVCILVSS